MADQLKPYHFKPGQSGNPAGGPKLSPEVRMFRQTSYQDFILALQKYGNWPIMKLEAELLRPDLGAFDHMFVVIVLKAAKGDAVTRELLINRLWGKVKDMPDNDQVTKLSNTELIAMAKDAIRILEAPTVQIEASKADE